MAQARVREAGPEPGRKRIGKYRGVPEARDASRVATGRLRALGGSARTPGRAAQGAGRGWLCRAALQPHELCHMKPLSGKRARIQRAEDGGVAAVDITLHATERQHLRR